jgi:hypothetical protein
VVVCLAFQGLGFDEGRKENREGRKGGKEVGERGEKGRGEEKETNPNMK